MINSFCAGDLIIIKQASLLFSCDPATGGGLDNLKAPVPASIRIVDKPKIGLYLGCNKGRNEFRVLVDNAKWLAKPKDCSHYNKQFHNDHFKLREDYNENSN